ncbi:MAG: Bax inhibitor-1/YccA family protein [Lachnospiraceae bacterium]|nr:Bax inhibitor-1/YccA family protein [Lachnospiraceae bacterium]
MEQNNPYGFHLNQNEAVYQTNLNNENGYETYATQPNMVMQNPYAGVADITARKKKAFIISLGIMCAGLVLSVFSAFVCLIAVVLFTELFLPLIIGSIVLEFSMVFATSHCISKNKVGAGIVCYVLFALANGTTFMSIFINYAPASILGIFLLTAVIFGGTAIVALIIPGDMSRWQASLVMGLIALVILSVAYLIFPVPLLDLFICFFGIVLFIAITVYDVKKINVLATENTSLSIWTVGLFGGMNLYLDFVNLLLKILRLFGRRK